MRKKYFLLFLLFSVLVVSGCSAKIDSSFVAPQEHAETNERIFNATYDEVWKATVDSIGKSFYVLENIEKDSGIMSLTFAAKTPSEFIDCGTVNEAGSLFGTEYNISYKGAESVVTKKIVGSNGIPLDVLRTLKLRGKSNVMVKKIDHKTTSVRVNTRYIIELTYSGSEPISVGFNTIWRPFSITNTMEFTGSELGAFSVPASMTCKSTFVLERTILDGIRVQLAK